MIRILTTWIATFVTASSMSMFAQTRLRITVPPNDNNPDVTLPGSTQIVSNSDGIVNYVALINKYLRIAMVVVAFVVIIWIGFKLMTSDANTKEGMDALKKGLTALGVGVGIILFSYAIVRLVVNLL